LLLTNPIYSEALYEDDAFPERRLAALVLAKVYYHLQEYNESMAFALGAGDLFQLDNGGEFEETIISKCVDQYIAVSASHHLAPSDKANGRSGPTLATSFSNGTNDLSASAVLASPTTPFSQSTLPSKSLLSRTSTDTLLEAPAANSANAAGSQISSVLSNRETQIALQKVIERLFESCLLEKRYRQVVGIAIEARNLEVLRRVIKRASDDEKKAGETPGSPSVTEELMEYVLDICMGVVQERGFRSEILKLILDLLNDIPSPDYFSIAKCVVYLNQDEEASTMLRTLVAKGDQTHIAIAYQIAFDLYDNGTQEFLGKVRKALPAEEKPEPPVATESEQLLSELNEHAGAPSPSSDEALSIKEQEVYKNIRSILDGSKTIKLNLEFLYRNNHTGMCMPPI
jgi:26S proteasome regulatory subunit N2